MLLRPSLSLPLRFSSVVVPLLPKSRFSVRADGAELFSIILLFIF